MPERECDNIIYLYDGSCVGMLSCIFEAFDKKENPRDICCFDDEQPSLFEKREVAADPTLAERVLRGVRGKLGPQAEQWILDAYYSCLAHRELAALEFVKVGFIKGPGMASLLNHPQVFPLFSASRKLRHEAHQYTGFVRFSEHGGVLVSVIQPKNFILPFIEPHFSDRFPKERYLIYDQTHRYALAVQCRESRLVPLEGLQLPDADAGEQAYRALWRQFYDTIAIEARHNPRCRMNHLPKRYWDCMAELEGAKKPLPVSVRQALAAGDLTLPGQTVAPAIATPTQVSIANARRAQAAALLPDASPSLPEKDPTVCQKAAGRLTAAV